MVEKWVGRIGFEAFALSKSLVFVHFLASRVLCCTFPIGGSKVGGWGAVASARRVADVADVYRPLCEKKGCGRANINYGLI
jgi:hypothetical protein